MCERAQMGRIVDAAFSVPAGEGRKWWLSALARLCDFLDQYEADGSAIEVRLPLPSTPRAYAIRLGCHLLYKGTDSRGGTFRIWSENHQGGSYRFIEDTGVDSVGQERDLVYDGTTGSLFEVSRGFGADDSAIDLTESEDEKENDPLNSPVGRIGNGQDLGSVESLPNAYEWSTGVEFNDYNGEKEVFIDEFDKLDFTRYKWEYWLRLFDIYSFSARILYGTVPILADTFILTMNQEPSTMWAGVGWARRLASAEVIEWKREMWVDDVAMFDQ